MKLSTREDIGLPIADVWAAVSDYAAFERAALRRGAELSRSDAGGVPVWKVSFVHSGKLREIEIREAASSPPSAMRFDAVSKPVAGVLEVSLLELARNRTRLNVALELTPRTLPGRLLLQSLKLAKGKITRRFRSRVSEFASGLDRRSARPG